LKSVWIGELWFQIQLLLILGWLNSDRLLTVIWRIVWIVASSSNNSWVGIYNNCCGSCWFIL
jgi:hypothetical protein